MSEPCRVSICCPPDDFAQSSVDADNCPPGYIWDGDECVPDDCVVQTTELPDGDVGVAYMANVAAEGFLMQFGWSLQGGSLPDGLTLNEDGMITGTPTVAGTFTFIVEATPFA